MRLILSLVVVLTFASADAFAFGKRNKGCNSCVVPSGGYVVTSQPSGCNANTCGSVYNYQPVYSYVVPAGGYYYSGPVIQGNYYQPLVVGGCSNGSCKIR